MLNAYNKQQEAEFEEAESAKRKAQVTATLTEREVAVERRAAALQKRDKEEALAKIRTPQQRARQEAASAARSDLAHHRSGALLNASQYSNSPRLSYCCTMALSRTVAHLAHPTRL